MSDINKRLNEIIYLLHSKHRNGECLRVKSAKQAIKQLMVDEFGKMIEGLRKVGLERFYNDKDYSIDAWIDDVDTYLVKKLKELNK